MHSGALTAQARAFLERRFARAADGSYFPHQPLGGLFGESEAGQPLRLARSYRLLRWLTALAPQSLADLGAAEGYIANLVRLLIGCPTICIDLSLEACRRAAEIHGQPAVASPLQRIPLPDASVDAVLLSEVFEHLENPVQVLCEMRRVARRWLVLTTQEICKSRAEQSIRLRLRELSEAHGELNWLRSSDLHAVFSGPAASVPQFRRSLQRLSAQLDPLTAEAHLHWLADPEDAASEGIIFVASLDGSPVPPLPRGIDEQLWRMLISGPPPADPQQHVWQLADGRKLRSAEALDSGTEPAEALATATAPLAPLDEAALARLAARLDPRRVSHNPLERRLLSVLVRAMERTGYLTCSDPLPRRLAWLRSRLFPQRTQGQIHGSEPSSG